ncbi:hypothetical protein [Actinomadura verrucosospora]|uniref:Uncharacterized protein n=1 Tax=Actinomadura verrucosospora TaxID=46165 RepID=A0A7D3W226_ACTVE|nr:hypothetical protein [Actinomadura verrucosospora]QKG24231.1 hypothetical protein ACTIVE_5874 [Actinomadura verrucosospora]
MNDRPTGPAPWQGPAEAAGRRLIPEQVHAAAFLAYALAASLLGFAIVGGDSSGEPTGQTFDGTPCYGTTADGLCRREDPLVPPALVLVLVLLALLTAAAGLAVHFGAGRARAALAVLAVPGALGSLLLLGAPGAGAKVAAVVSVGACVVMARLPYTSDGARYFAGQVPLRAAALADPARARPSGAPGAVWLAAAYFSVPAAFGVVASLVSLVHAPAAAPAGAALAALAGSVAAGLVRGRLWARAYAVTALVLGLAAGVAVLAGLWEAATPDRHDPFAPEPPSVGGYVTLTLVLMGVNAVMLWALLGDRRASDFYARGT